MIKAIRYALLVSAMSGSMIVPAYAYLDPGTGSIILQAIIGGVAATMFVLRGYYYRIRGWLGLASGATDERRAGKE